LNRRIVQIIAAVVFNGHFTGFLRGTVYNGSLKKICVPVLNCTSCPGVRKRIFSRPARLIYILKFLLSSVFFFKFNAFRFKPTLIFNSSS
jgi:hypothetical protein